MQFKVLFTFFIIFISSCAQGQKLKDLIKFGDNNFEEGDYYGASLYYKQAVDAKPEDPQLRYKLAESFRLFNNYKDAEKQYRKLYGIEKGKMYPMGLFWLASMQKHNGDYAKSMKTWKRYQQKAGRNRKSYEYQKAKQEIISCKFALKMGADSLVILENIGEPINSYIAEFGAFLKDSTLYFSSLRAKKMNDDWEVKDKVYEIRIYKSNKQNGVYSEAVALDSLINESGSHTANSYFDNQNGDLYFVRCTKEFNCHIYFAENKNGKFDKPKKLGTNINLENFTSTQPMITKIGEKKYLFFVSNRQGGSGKMDVWYSEQLPNGNFGTAVNAGKKINTLDNDISPFYDSDNKLLYFSSEWHEGMGGYDIFKSEGLPGSFGKPKNLSVPFNTSANDYYFTIDSKTKEGFLTSNREGSLYQKSPTCCNDIYTFEYPESIEEDSMKIESLEDLNKYLPVTLYFHNDEPNPRTWDSVTNQNYYNTYLGYKDLKPTYLTEYTKGLYADHSIEAKEEMNSFFDSKVDKGVADLELFSQLLTEQLEKGERIILTVKGFASPLAKTDYNVKLTGRRISSLVNFMNEYQNKKIASYIADTAVNGGNLNFVKIPFGEYTADTLVSDNLQNLKSSVYSRSAALERKIQIISITRAKKDSVYAEIKFDKEIHDFGFIASSDTLIHTFRLTNTGNKELQIDSIASASEWLKVPSINFDPIAPGASFQIPIELYGGTQQGFIVHTLTIYSNANQKERVLSITGEIKRGQ